MLSNTLTLAEDLWADAHKYWKTGEGRMLRSETCERRVIDPGTAGKVNINISEVLAIIKWHYPLSLLVQTQSFTPPKFAPCIIEWQATSHLSTASSHAQNIACCLVFGLRPRDTFIRLRALVSFASITNRSVPSRPIRAIASWGDNGVSRSGEKLPDSFARDLRRYAFWLYML